MAEKLTFKLEEIPPEGLEFALAADPGLYDIRDVKVVNPPGVSGWLKIVKGKADLSVRGVVKARVQAPCNRCLGPAAEDIGGEEFSFFLMPRTRMPAADEMELSQGELEVAFLEGDEVDVRRIVAEQVYLNVPLKMLCRADCKGLCPACGQDLNQKDCGHRAESGDARWEALKQLKLKGNIKEE